MSLIADIAIGMSVNTRDFTAKMATADKTLGKFAATAGQAQAATGRLSFASATRGIGRMATVAASAGGAVAALGAAIATSKAVQGIGNAVEAASELNEQLSKSSVVFGPAAAKVEADARKMGDAYGYPIAQFIDGASSIGLIAKASGLTQTAAADLGSDFAKLAADASSFYNVPVDEALGAIRSGLVGEAEPMRRFGVLLNEAAVANETMRLGLSKTGKDLTEGVKVQARASLITKGLADATGDLGRTFNSASNLSRAAEGRWTNAMADLGAAIQPVSDKFFALRESALKALTEGLNENAAAIGAWAAEAGSGSGLVVAAFDSVVGGIGFAADAIQTLNIGLKAGQAFFVNLAYAGVNCWNSIGESLSNFLRDAAGMPRAVWDAEHAFTASMKASAEAANADLAKLAAAPRASEAIKARAAAAKANAKPVQPGAPKAAPKAENPAEIASKEALKAQKKLADEAKRVFEETRTPMEQYRIELGKLQKLFDAKAIDSTTFARAKAKAREDAFGKPEPQFAGALTSGSAEAYSAQLRFAAMGDKADEPIKEVAKKTGEQVDVSKQILTGINRLVDKVGAGIGGAVGELFAI